MISTGYAHKAICTRPRGARIYLYFTIVCLVLMLTSHAVIAGNLSTPRYFDIEAQSLDQALLEFGTQAHVQIMFASKAALGAIRTTQLSGRYTGEQALAKLLGQSRLAVVKHGNTIEIVPLPSGPPAAHDNPIRQAGQQGKGSVSTRPAGDPPTVPEPQKKITTKQKATALQEVVVTGSHIADIRPISPVTVITLEDINNTGLPDITSAIRALPENFSGGENPGVVGTAGSINGGDSESGMSTVNLRGLGPQNTLVLLDGHRLAANGADGTVDLSSIPTAAVQEVQIETGGASAVYGSDAVAGVVNIILRKNYNGEQTTAYVESTADGGGFIQRYSQLVGRSSDQGGLMLGYQFEGQNVVTAGERAVSETVGTETYLQPRHKANSLFLAGHYHLSSSLVGHVEGTYNHGTTQNREDGEDENASLDQFITDAGITYHGDAGRTLDADVSEAGDNRYVLVYAPGSPNYIEQQQSGESEVTLTGQGELLTLPGARAIEGAAGVGYRKSTLLVPNVSLALGGGAPLREQAQQKVEDAFFELNVPVVPTSDGVLGLDSMTINGAGRYNHYSDFGASFSPKVGIAYVPIKTITVSGTLGRSFFTPTLDEMYGISEGVPYPGYFFGLPASAEVLLTAGSNRNLKPQTAATWDATLQWLPRMSALYGLTTRVTYYDIEFHNRINTPIPLITEALNPEFGPFVIEHPSAAAVNEALSSVSEVENFFGLSTSPNAFSAIVNDELQNITLENVHGVDASVGYVRTFSWGDVTLDAAGSWLSFDQRAFAGQAPFAISGTLFEPPSFKMRDMIGWNRGRWGTSLYVNHVSGELNPVTSPISNVGPWTTIDGQLRFIKSDFVSTLKAVELRLSVENISNHSPPRIAPISTYPPGIDFDAANYSAIGRTYAFSVAVSY